MNRNQRYPARPTSVRVDENIAPSKRAERERQRQRSQHAPTRLTAARAQATPDPPSTPPAPRHPTRGPSDQQRHSATCSRCPRARSTRRRPRPWASRRPARRSARSGSTRHRWRRAWGRARPSCRRGCRRSRSRRCRIWGTRGRRRCRRTMVQDERRKRKEELVGVRAEGGGRTQRPVGPEPPH